LENGKVKEQEVISEQITAIGKQELSVDGRREKGG
jgi:hypothetical protein